MKHTAVILILLALLLTLSSCSLAQSAENTPQMPQADLSESDATQASRTAPVAGNGDILLAYHYTDPGYSLYLPDDWVQDEPSHWHASNCESIELQVQCLAADQNGPMDIQRCYDTITAQDHFCGVDQMDFWSELDGNTFWGSCSGSFFQLWLTEQEDDCWALIFMFSAESFKDPTFAAIADTFKPA